MKKGCCIYTFIHLFTHLCRLFTHSIFWPFLNLSRPLCLILWSFNVTLKLGAGKGTSAGDEKGSPEGNCPLVQDLMRVSPKWPSTLNICFSLLNWRKAVIYASIESLFVINFCSSCTKQLALLRIPYFHRSWSAKIRAYFFL